MIKIFVLLSMYSVFIPFFFGIMQIRRTNSYLILLFLLVSCSGLADFIVHINYAWIPIVHAIFDVVQYTIIFLIFISQTKSIPLKKLLLSFLILLIVYTLTYHLFIDGSTIALLNSQTVSTFAIIASSLLFINRIPLDIPSSNLFRHPLFWFCIAVLTYFAGNLFLFIAKNIFTMEKMYMLYYPIHNVLNATKNILFAVAFFTQYKSINKLSQHE